MKTIPQVRSELLELAETVSPSAGRKIKYLVRQMKRRPSVRKANKESVTFTPTLARSIRTFATRNPANSYKTIAAQFNVSVGRVSEAIAGKRQAA